MKIRRIFILAFCLLLLPLTGWSGQNLLIKGREAQKAGNNEVAAKLLGEYLKRYPQMEEARRYYALALAGLGRKAEALEQLNRALAADPQDVQLLLAKGKVLAGLDKRSEAIEVYSRVIKLDPNNAEAYKERGDNRAQEGSFQEALQDLNRAARLAPRDPWVFNKRGMAQFCLGDYRAAVADFSTAIRLAPDSPLAYFFRGNIYRHHLGEMDKAVADYRKGCQLGHSLCCQELEKLGLKPAGK
jgi:tetratricopeptide (TPR) repeat protein